MHTLKLWRLFLFLVVATLVAWGFSVLARRLSWPPLELSYSSLIVLGVVSLALFALGWRVRAWRNGQRKRPLNPLFAVRMLLLAQASAYAGVLLCGWHTGRVVDRLWTSFFAGERLGSLTLLFALAGGGCFLAVTGCIVERFCRLPPDKPEISEDVPEQKENIAPSEG